MAKCISTDSLQIKGRYYLTARDKRTGLIVARVESGNLVTTVGKNHLCNFLLGISGWNVGEQYQAIGTGTTAPAIGDVKLVTEFARIAITSMPSTGTNQATFSTFFTAAQSTVFIKEVGLFGKSATGAADSGIILSRALLSYDNSAGLNDLTLSYVLTFT